MNLNKWLLLAVLATVSLTFASCGSDDEDDKLANELVGTYTGYVSSVSYTGEATAKVTSTGSNSVKFEIVTPDNTSLPSVTSDLMSVDNNTIGGTTTARVALLYYKKEKNLSIAKGQEPNIYVFEGTKN